jgi:hypothetical protein
MCDYQINSKNPPEQGYLEFLLQYLASPSDGSSALAVIAIQIIELSPSNQSKVNIPLLTVYPADANYYAKEKSCLGALGVAFESMSGSIRKSNRA